MAQRTSSAGTTRSRAASARSGSATKSAGKKAPAKKSAAKKAPAKKPATKAATKKSAAKKAPAKSPAKKSAAKKAPAKTPAKKAPAPRAVTKAAAKKAAPKKASAKKTAAKKTPATKTSAPKASAKKSAAAVASAADSTAVAKVAPPRPVVPLKKAAVAPKRSARGRKPLTPAERLEMRGVLRAERSRLKAEIAAAVEDLNELLRDSGDGSGDDQADAGSKTFEREHEMSVANNSRDLLEQVEHALKRISDGSYGTCESCALPIGKMRLEAFPRATLCVDCKQREERR